MEYSASHWKNEQNKREYYQMYFTSPLAKQDIKVLEDLSSILNLYTQVINEKGDESDFVTVLKFSNWVTLKMKKDHALGLTFPTKEMLALVFIMEAVHDLKSNWTRNLEGELKGNWRE